MSATALSYQALKGNNERPRMVLQHDEGKMAIYLVRNRIVTGGSVTNEQGTVSSLENKGGSEETVKEL